MGRLCHDENLMDLFLSASRKLPSTLKIRNMFKSKHIFNWSTFISEVIFVTNNKTNTPQHTMSEVGPSLWNSSPNGTLGTGSTSKLGFTIFPLNLILPSQGHPPLPFVFLPPSVQDPQSSCPVWSLNFLTHACNDLLVASTWISPYVPKTFHVSTKLLELVFSMVFHGLRCPFPYADNIAF